MTFCLWNSLNDIVLGSFAIKFAFFAHFMYFRSKTCYDLRTFSWGKFIWKELICVKNLTFCNSVHIFKYISRNTYLGIWNGKRGRNLPYFPSSGCTSNQFQTYFLIFSTGEHQIRNTEFQSSCQLNSLRLRLKVGHTNWSKETSFAIWASELLVFPILLFTDRKL